MTHIEFLVEEPSAEVVLRCLTPQIVGQDVSFRVHPFQGKQDLLNRLPDRLRGYRAWLPPDWRIVVLIDADDEDCRQLKARLEETALQRAGYFSAGLEKMAAAREIARHMSADVNRSHSYQVFRKALQLLAL